jgi:hypothetical protein
MYGMDSSGSESGPVAGCCEHDNEHLGYIKDEEFIDYLSDSQLLNNDIAPWI